MLHMALMSLQSRSHVKTYMVLTRADHLFIHNYTGSPLNIILIVRMGIESIFYYLTPLPIEPHRHMPAYETYVSPVMFNSLC